MGVTEKLYKIELRDLQSLINKKLGNHVIVVKFSTDSLVPFGENYGSTILKVDATVKRDRDAKEENLSLVAKMPPPTDYQRKIFDSAFTFKKETFFYEKLIPSYQALEREFGIAESELLDIVPEFYGARFSLKPDVDFDDDAVILMENLKTKGYYLTKRKEGMDFPHAKASVIALARFHGLGMAMKQNKPDYFEYIKENAKCLKIADDINWDEPIKFFLKVMREVPDISPHYERLERFMSTKPAKTLLTLPPEPWRTVVHSDFWANNIMFKKNTATNFIENVKFVDFQNFLILSPLRELTFFLMTNLNAHVMQNNFDELSDIYYENFIDVLKRMKCDMEPFSRDKFDERWKIDAFDEFSHCPFMLKIMTTEVGDEADETSIKDLVVAEGNPLLLERLRRCVKKYVDKGWL